MVSLYPSVGQHDPPPHGISCSTQYCYLVCFRDGDLYAALCDSQTALRLDTYFRLAKCLYKLSWPKEAFECLNHFRAKFPDCAKSKACEQLDKEIRAAVFAELNKVCHHSENYFLWG